ncbi:MAG: NAD-dependent epimerase/dehydratase family protein [Parvularculaceae bacterium]
MSVSLVTGGAGFVGKTLVEALRARGERVRSFDLAPPRHGDDVQGSILDRDALGAAMVGVDAVFHLAGNAQLWARRAELFDEVNHLGARNVVQAAQAAGVEKFVHCSSLTTLVGRSTPIGRSTADENLFLGETEMLGAYPLSKLRAERAVIDADGAMERVIVIPTEPLGGGDESLTPPSKMIVDLVNGKTPATIDCTLNFSPLHSLAQGMIAARDRGVNGERYILGGENVSMRRLLVALEKISGVKMPKARLPYGLALLAGVVDTGLSGLTGKAPTAPLTGVRLAGRRVEFSSEKAARALGWRASPFEDALREAVDWFRQRGVIR